MKLLIITLVLVFIVACGKSGGSPGASDKSAPAIVTPDSIVGKWVNGMSFCTQVAGQWSCADLASEPAACVPIDAQLGWFVIDAGFNVSLGMVMNVVTYANNQMTFSVMPWTWSTDFLSDDEMIITYAPGCSNVLVRQ